MNNPTRTLADAPAGTPPVPRADLAVAAAAVILAADAITGASPASDVFAAINRG